MPLAAFSGTFFSVPLYDYFLSEWAWRI